MPIEAGQLTPTAARHGYTRFGRAPSARGDFCYNKPNNEQDSVDPSKAKQDDIAMRLPGQDNQPPPDAAAGEHLVFYEYCISLVFVSLRRPSVPVRLRPGQRGWIKGLPYTIVTLLLGWWCIPWGLLYTPLCLWTNLSGGRPIAAEELGRWGQSPTGKG